MSNAIGWDDEIEKEGNGFTVLNEGDYAFEVVNFERGSFPGSPKIDPCNKAILTLRVSGELDDVDVRYELIMSSVMEWKISEFFRGIGQKKPGQKIKPDWSKVVGSRGSCHIRPRTYMGKNDGLEHKTNDVTKIYDYNENSFKPKEATGGYGGF